MNWASHFIMEISVGNFDRTIGFKMLKPCGYIFFLHKRVSRWAQNALEKFWKEFVQPARPCPRAWHGAMAHAHFHAVGRVRTGQPCQYSHSCMPTCGRGGHSQEVGMPYKGRCARKRAILQKPYL